jgi:hypothetical protein
MSTLGHLTRNLREHLGSIRREVKVAMTHVPRPYAIPREDLQWPRKLWIRRGRSGQAAVMSARGKRFLRY